MAFKAERRQPWIQNTDSLFLLGLLCIILVVILDFIAIIMSILVIAMNMTVAIVLIKP